MKIRLVFVVPWLIAIAPGLFAQERPVLNAAIVTNFIENMASMDEAFFDIEEESDYLNFMTEIDKFSESLMVYLEGGSDDFSAFRTAFIRVKNVRAPNVERVLTKFGLGQRGIEAFFVILLGMTISLMEDRFEAALSNADPDALNNMDTEDLRRLEEVQDKFVMLRGLIHPEDMAVLENDREALRQLLLK
ncbi:MAG: hypothetical protein LBP29_02570 [Treponema sp.]|jgi:hypothetical protein|nr:hypothetical protein [Treponema sp.]